MLLLPAIDILGGHAVRLERGDFTQQTLYSDDPVNAAQSFVRAGARALHVVDLDGARAGVPRNLDQVRRITAAVNVPVELGGGLRSTEAIAAALKAGARSVILGTAALDDPQLVATAVAGSGDRLVVSLDARAGLVATGGWSEQTEVPVRDAIASLQAAGVRRFVYSSIERDGMLTGPDLEGARDVAAAVSGSFVYSGGIAELADLRALAELRLPNLSGVIAGKALYERKFGVRDAQQLLDRLG
jgi:phosphoribosylformimino-5-aminoimidazole carboxamide ribotide isomerase